MDHCSSGSDCLKGETAVGPTAKIVLMFGLPYANMLADIASVAEKPGNEGTNVQYAYEFATDETYWL